jgi:ABC-2 type transport system ATP-binding protein
MARDGNALRSRLGIQLQETLLSEKLTVAESVKLFRSFYPAGRSVEEVIGLVQLDEKRGSRVGTLSGGQKQRLASRARSSATPTCSSSTSHHGTRSPVAPAALGHHRQVPQ